MKYSTEFKERCIKTFLGKDKVSDLMSSMENNNHTKVRYLLEDLADITQFNFDEYIYTNRDAQDHNSQLDLYREARALYAEFMEAWIAEIDKQVECQVKEESR